MLLTDNLIITGSPFNASPMLTGAVCQRRTGISFSIEVNSKFTKVEFCELGKFDHGLARIFGHSRPHDAQKNVDATSGVTSSRFISIQPDQSRGDVGKRLRYAQRGKSLFEFLHLNNLTRHFSFFLHTNKSYVVHIF